MVRKNIYVRDDDEEIWQKAEQLTSEGAAESLSKMITNALKKEVIRLENQKEAKKTEIFQGADIIEKITVEYEEDGIKRKISFKGKWITDEEGINTVSNLKLGGLTGYDHIYRVALTEKNQFFVFEESIQFNEQNDGLKIITKQEGSYKIYSSFEKMKKDLPGKVSKYVADAIEYAYEEFLDI